MCYPIKKLTFNTLFNTLELPKRKRKNPTRYKQLILAFQHLSCYSSMLKNESNMSEIKKTKQSMI